MVRVAGLKGQVENDVPQISPDGLTPVQQIAAINAQARNLMAAQQDRWRDLRAELREAGIDVLTREELSPDDRNWLAQYFMEKVFPTLMPLAIDPAHLFPFIPNGGMAMVLDLKRGGSRPRTQKALVPVPHQIPRFVRLPGEQQRWLFVEDVIADNLGELFPGFTVICWGMFRVIRDSEMDIDEEAEDLVRTFESALKRRRRGNVIRLSVSAGMADYLRELTIEETGIEEVDVFTMEGMVGMVDVKQLISSERPDLLFQPYNARFPERIRNYGGDCLAAIAAKDIIVHHPYESFDVVVQFLRQAAQDPKVITIKQTLYRTSNDSPIVRALIEAAEAGKSVTAVVELKARFDEAANIRWARNLERAGANVVFGFLDLKTHAKLSLVVRREGTGLRTYCHFGTGNYHPITAKVYTDLSYFTTDPALGRDAAKAFNFISGYAEPKGLEKLSLSPRGMRDVLIASLEEEIAHVKAGRPGRVWAKMNSLVDEEVIDALYRASQAGVQIDMVIRGICCLRPGLPGLSETIRVRSIVGRFLEHSRIVCFGSGEELPNPKAKVYISSADWMQRNLSRRVEALVPLSPESKTVHMQVMTEIMQTNLRDEAQSWRLDAEGRYTRVEAGENAHSAHTYFMTNPNLSGRGRALDKGRPGNRPGARQSRHGR